MFFSVFKFLCVFRFLSSSWRVYEDQMLVFSFDALYTASSKFIHFLFLFRKRRTNAVDHMSCGAADDCVISCICFPSNIFLVFFWLVKQMKFFHSLFLVLIVFLLALPYSSHICPYSSLVSTWVDQDCLLSSSFILTWRVHQKTLSFLPRASRPNNSFLTFTSDKSRACHIGTSFLLTASGKTLKF